MGQKKWDASLERKPQRAGIYCRLSYAPDGSLEKVERQEADCRELAKRLDWPVSEAHIFPDNSRSAWQKNRKRPQWDRMLRAIEDGEIDAVIVYHGDRLIRQPYDLEKLIGIADSKSLRIASPSGTRNLDSPDDRFILRIEAAQACRESDNTSRRVRDGHATLRKKGLTTVGGRRPFGFGIQTGTKEKIDPATDKVCKVPVFDLTRHRPDEARGIRGAADYLLASRNQRATVRWLNERHTTTEGNPFDSKSLRNILTAPRTAGLIEHQGEFYKAAWRPILARDTWEMVRAFYASSAAAHPHSGRERVHLLSGRGGAECGPCLDDQKAAGKPAKERVADTLRTKPSGGRNRKSARLYFCEVCRRVGRNSELLDRYIEGRTVALLNDPRFLSELSTAPDHPDLTAELLQLEERKAALSHQVENMAQFPNVRPELAFAALASFDTEIAKIRAQIAETTEDRLLAKVAGISAEKWAALPLDTRASTVRALFRVTILRTTLRGPGFDTSSVRVERRRREGQQKGK
ncbi:recombinase family protein [Streptomyces sp. NPDC006477]|uniref:recombinase family protein n=1 Tax=Streptomyces sp. NPDC006477 TaxID=3364747 RepID=UPI0036CBFE2E